MTSRESHGDYCKALPASRAMKLWIVEGGGWGASFNVVRAATADDAFRVAHKDNATATELEPEGEEAILWSWEHSPDTPRDE